MPRRWSTSARSGPTPLRNCTLWARGSAGVGRSLGTVRVHSRARGSHHERPVNLGEEGQKLLKAEATGAGENQRVERLQFGDHLQPFADLGRAGAEASFEDDTQGFALLLRENLLDQRALEEPSHDWPPQDFR